LTAKKFGSTEELTGAYRVAAFSVLQELQPGSAPLIAEGLRSIAVKLNSGNALHPGEASYLANALLRVANSVEKFGAPFGYRARTGRPGLDPLQRLALGRRVDELNKPERYHLNAPSLPLEENSGISGGAYLVAAEEAGCSDKTARRAYKEYRNSKYSPKTRLSFVWGRIPKLAEFWA
jgi:hypothetical protein